MERQAMGEDSLVGHALGHFRVVEKIGAGGMGVVYRAHDERLDRDVALKVLPPERVADSNRRRRFVQEARAASALKHPNIITIHDIDEAGGVNFIAMEYVEGKTLERLIARQGLLVNEALKYAVQITAALAKAHSAGIVHRDLKPSNIMVTEEGLVKVLDFGLAKLTEPAPTGEVETVATMKTRTEEGTIVGTVGYMSPEQAEGKPVDARSDIFSFGSVLYEMLTGTRAFRGETNAATVAAILRQEPKPVSEVAQGVPREVERLVKRCLRKDPAQRVQHMDDLKVALEELKEESDSGELGSATGVAAVSDRRMAMRTSPLQGRWLFALVGVAALVLAGAVLWEFLRTPSAPKVSGIHQISHTGRLKGNAVVLTDGARVYFTDLVEGHRIPMVVSALGGDAVPIPMPFKDVAVCAITPDNTELVIASFDHDPDGWHPSWWRVPVIGGSPIRIGDSQVESVIFTPDGQLMFQKGSDIYLAKADGTGARKLLTAPPGWPDYKYFSPDMSRLRFTVFDFRNEISSALWETSHDGSHLRRFLPDWNRGGSECCGTWTRDGKYYVFQATVDGITSLYWLREGGVFTTGSRQPVQLMAMPLRNSVPMVSRDGKKLFFLGSQSRAELSVYNSVLQEFVPYLGGIPAEGVSFSKDGQWVAYVRLPEGTLWRMRLDGSNQLQLTFPPMKVYAPRWSPDGKRIAFYVPADGHSRIYTIPREGGAPESQTSGEPGAHDPTWSPDGNALMFDYGGNVEDSSVQTLDLKTHAVTELPGSKGIFAPRWSPDGRYVAALMSRDTKLMLFDFRTQKWEALAGSGAGFPNWSKDSKYVFFNDSHGVFYRVEINTHKTEEVARQGNAQAANGIVGYPWRGVTLDGSPLIVREAGLEEVYALDVNFP